MRWLSLAILAVASCGDGSRALPPRGQVLLFIDTDAPLPPAEGTPSPMAPLPLFDRLRLDVSDCADPVQCPPMTRDFPIDEARLRAVDLSIGIVPRAPGDRPMVRARLFLFAGSVQVDPVADVTIDVTTVLPEVSAEGVIERTLFLPTDRVGQPSAQVDTSEGRPATSAVGSWPGAQRIDCAAPPNEGEVCVPGGAFWMGSARMRDFRIWLDPAADARRLVVLSPFYLDAREVTVAEVRAAHTPAVAFSGTRDGTSQTDWCTYTATTSANDGLPANCVRRSDAIAHCAASGRELPTEAQFEYAASSLGRSLWPWGNDVPSCSDAIVARAYGAIAPDNFTDSAACLGSKIVAGPLAAGTALRDRVELPGQFGGAVFDLVGNLSEQTRDIYQYRDDDCWSRPGVYVDPICDHYGTAAHGFLLKGGNFWWLQGLSFAPLRFPVSGDDPDPLWGFRCVRKAQ